MDSLDQAAGLRRILAQSAMSRDKGFVTFLSALSPSEKNIALLNLSAGLVQLRKDVALLDMTIPSDPAHSLSGWLRQPIHMSLTDVAKAKGNLEQAIQFATQGFKWVSCYSSAYAAPLTEPFLMSEVHALIDRLACEVDIVLADADLTALEEPVANSIENSVIVVLVTHHPESVKKAYALIKQVHQRLGRRSYSLLVTDVTENQAQRIYSTIARVADDFLSVPLTLMGYVPRDDYLKQASLSGGTVLDVFPEAKASLAFAHLARQLSLCVPQGSECYV